MLDAGDSNIKQKLQDGSSVDVANYNIEREPQDESSIDEQDSVRDFRRVEILHLPIMATKTPELHSLDALTSVNLDSTYSHLPLEYSIRVLLRQIDEKIQRCQDDMDNLEFKLKR